MGSEMCIRDRPWGGQLRNSTGWIVSIAGTAEGYPPCAEAWSASGLPETISMVHHHCPSPGARQKDFRSHPSYPTIRRHTGAEFGTVSGVFDRIENGYTQPIEPYRDFARKIRCQPKSSEGGSASSSGNFGQEKRPYKSWTCRPSKTVSAVLRVRCSTS